MKKHSGRSGVPAALLTVIAMVVFIGMPAVASELSPTPSPETTDPMPPEVTPTDPTPTAPSPSAPVLDPDGEALPEQPPVKFEPVQGRSVSTQADSDCGDEVYEAGKYKPGEPIPWLKGEGWPCWPDIPEPGNPYPFGVSNPPYLPDPQGESLKTGDPDPGTCPAPTLPAATDEDSADGYTVPIRLKLSNGRVTGGFTPNAYRFGQFPFSTWGTLTGWIVGSVRLPSMQVTIEPAGVLLCGGGFHLANASYQLEGYPESEWTARASYGWWFDDDGNYLPDARFQEISGTLHGLLYEPSSPLQLRLKRAVAEAVSTSVSGVTSDGRLRVGSSLTNDIELRWFNRITGVDNPNYCHFSMAGDLSTDPKKVVQPETQTGFAAGNPVAPPGGWTVGVPPAIPAEVLMPNKSLSGAIEGGTATLGSNTSEFKFVEGRPLCFTALPNALYGYDADSISQMVSSAEDGYPGNPTPLVLKDIPRLSPGLSDLSIDLTVDRIGLPKYDDLPTGYGFE